MKRPGIDHDEVKPWNWATIILRSDPVEIVSYPCPVDGTIVIRMKVGDPTSIRTVPVKAIAAFSPDRHEWAARPRQFYGDNPTAFHFIDELEGADLAPDGCTNPGGHEWNRSAAEADEARLSGDYANDNIRCIHCDADGDS